MIGRQRLRGSVSVLWYIRCAVVVVGLVAMTAWQAHAGEEVIYYHNDTLGSPVAATDEQGNRLWQEEYQPYGERLLQQGNSQNTLWYTGKPEESDLGISYFGARWYDPSIGRFMSVDPESFSKENLHSFNKYAYGNLNPYKFIDPDGRTTEDLNFVVQWLKKNYAGLFSGSRSDVTIFEGNPSGGSATGVSSMIFNTIEVERNLPRAKLAGTIAHELLHLEGGFGKRFFHKFWINFGKLGLGGHGNSMHQFIHEFGNAVQRHFEQEVKIGRSLKPGEFISTPLLPLPIVLPDGSAGFVSSLSGYENMETILENIDKKEGK